MEHRAAPSARLAAALLPAACLWCAACASQGAAPLPATALLEGTWRNNSLILVVDGNRFTALSDGALYIKGDIVYDGARFLLTATHARQKDRWIPVSESAGGDCFVQRNIALIENAEGRYSMLNGIWKRIPPVNISAREASPQPRII